MATKKDYINLIRWSCILDSFIDHYFIRSIVLYLLSKGVIPWVAVSIPIVLEFAKLISRGFSPIVKLAIKVDYKKYHIFHLITFLLLGVVISQCNNVYTIYLFTIISGFLSGIKYSSITKLDTSNKEFESYCFIEEERAQVIGGVLGLVISQYIYDYNKTLYILGFFALIIIGTFLSLFLKNIKVNDVMEQIDHGKELSKAEKKNTILVTILFGILVGFWCVSWGAFEELSPLITKKVGYFNAIYTALETLLLFAISGRILDKIKKNGKLLLTETIIAIIDTACFLLSAIMLSWQGILIAYIITAFTGTLADPVWGSIISAYSVNDRKKYVIVNRVYFIVRGIFSLITWFVCRQCVIHGLESFRVLGFSLLFLILIMYVIANYYNKKIFKKTI
ncbi:MAG: hypothetical protein IJ094_05080 [Bacilli bacterium]|nr:hypothetical protein [Bacilli bacterium]